MKKYFGTDGIRSTGSYLLSDGFSYKVGKAIAKAFNLKEVIIGCDTRESSMPILKEVTKGLNKLGVVVYFQENATTPMISYYTKTKEMIGIMITASHNPYFDNGIKVFNKGYKTDDEIEEKIENYIDKINENGENLDYSYVKTNEPLNLYLGFFDTLSLHAGNINVCFDCANGASYKVIEEIIKRYVKKGKAYNVSPNGKNINDGVGSTHLEFLKSVVNAHDIGFAFDGDADRCLIVSKNGKIVDGDMMMYIYASYMRKKGLLKDNHVVLTKMSNPGILKAFKDENITYSLCDVGDKYVKAEMDEHSYNLGGEASGHIILNHLMHSGDGILMALYMLKILKEEGHKLEDYLEKVTLYPFKMINIKNVNKDVLKDEEIVRLTKKVKETFKEDYLVLIRPSGTEPLIRVTMSYKDEKILDEQINKMVDLIKEKGKMIWHTLLF